MVYSEGGHYEKSIKFLEDNQKYILDKLTLEEMRADSCVKANQKAKAIKIYEDLIERNPDNLVYYKKLEECLNLSKGFKSIEAFLA
jgi:peptide alpha-N-acetyltransferase